MLLFDVNIWIYTHREDTPKHKEYIIFVETVIANDISFGISTLAMSGFLRFVTHPKIFDLPTPLETALQFTEKIINHPDAVIISPGERHWDIFFDLCKTVDVKGNLIPDAYFAALAMESGFTWITTDRDYSRFPGLTWKHPLTDF